MKVESLEHSAILLTCINAIIGLENQFSVFLRVAVLHRFYCKCKRVLPNNELVPI